jgi:hypothetical protein
VDQQNTDPIIESAESVVEPTKEEIGNKAVDLMNIEKLIINYIGDIERVEADLKKEKELLENILENSDDYKKASEAAKEATKEKTRIKSDLLKQPEAAGHAQKVAEVKADIKQMRDNLSKYLQQYGQLAGTNQFEDNDGQVREIVYMAKLVKRSSKFRT